MIDKRKLELFRELFNRSERILVMCSADALKDQMLAATSLYAVLKANSQKNIKLFFPSQSQVEKTDVLYASDAKMEIGHENLCISLDYEENSVDKVSYHISEETNKFYLTIRPKSGFPPLSDQKVEFTYTGAEADMIILVGVDDLNNLGKLYVGYEQLFNSTALVSINSYETQFGNLKYDILGTSCFSEFVAQVLLDLQLPIDPDSATNLLAGIKKETKGYESFTATADTFEIISKLLRAGARKIPTKVASIKAPTSYSGMQKEGEIRISERFKIANSDSLIVSQPQHVDQPKEEDITDLMTTNEVDEAERVEESKIVEEVGAEDLSGYEQSLLSSEQEMILAQEQEMVQEQPPAQQQEQEEIPRSPKPTANPPKTTPSPRAQRRAKKKNKRRSGFKKKKKSSRPGDLNYNPSGFGPTGG